MPESIAVIRPATCADLEHFSAFALESGPGITSLPRNKELLEEFLIQAEHSFASTIAPTQTEAYLFCLELNEKVIGASGLISRIGVDEPFFAFHKLTETLKSAALNIEREIDVLHFIEARKKPTEIGTLYLQKEFRGHGFGPLLSYSRFLFMTLNREKFASTVIAELRGVNYGGISPFWESLGRHFFGLAFSDADLMRTTHPEAIKELFPRYPIYTSLLPPEAQEVMGNPHPRTIPAKKMLEKQGFRLSEYLDIFDAGPHLYAPTDEIHAIHESQTATLRELRSELTSEITAIVANKKSDFRAALSPIIVEEERITLPMEVGEALNVDIGDEILYYNF